MEFRKYKKVKIVCIKCTLSQSLYQSLDIFTIKMMFVFLTPEIIAALDLSEYVSHFRMKGRLTFNLHDKELRIVPSREGILFYKEEVIIPIDLVETFTKLLWYFLKNPCNLNYEAVDTLHHIAKGMLSQILEDAYLTGFVPQILSVMLKIFRINNLNNIYGKKFREAEDFVNSVNEYPKKALITEESYTLLVTNVYLVLISRNDWFDMLSLIFTGNLSVQYCYSYFEKLFSFVQIVSDQDVNRLVYDLCLPIISYSSVLLKFFSVQSRQFFEPLEEVYGIGPVYNLMEFPKIMKILRYDREKVVQIILENLNDIGFYRAFLPKSWIQDEEFFVLICKKMDDMVEYKNPILMSFFERNDLLKKVNDVFWSSGNRSKLTNFFLQKDHGRKNLEYIARKSLPEIDEKFNKGVFYSSIAEVTEE